MVCPPKRDRTNMSVVTNDKEVDQTTVKKETLSFHLEEGMSVLNSSNRLSLPTTGQPTDIQSFVGRPYNFTSYTWSTSQTPGTDITNTNIMAWLNGITMYNDKFKGFRNRKFTVCLKFVLAASPFHAGALRISWIPWTACVNNYRGNMYKGLIPNSQLPGIMLTCEDNSAEMKIPYIGPVLGSDKAIGFGDNWDWGSFRICVYSALATGTGSSSVTLDGYMWLEDVELSGVFPQSKYKAGKKTKSQMLVTDNEIGEGSGPISRVLGSGAVLANRLGDFPVLTPFFKPAAWVLNALKGSAEAFGYSKPTTGERQEMCLMARTQDAYAPNTNGTDNCFSLSALGDAKTTMHTMMQITNFDESSFDYIKRQWSYYESFTIATSNVPNDVVYSKLIAPRTLNKSYLMPASASTNYTVYWMTPVAYLGEMFESYRGDIEVRFVFVKTGYHACQLEVAFSMSSVTSSSTEYWLREIVDLQKGNEVCFVLPYNRVGPFIPTFDPYGILQVTLVNTLQAPTSVANNINVMVFYRGGDSLTFSRPTNFAPMPIMGPQGAYTEDNKEAMCDKPMNIGNSTSIPKDMMSQYTAGEAINSLKQLSNRYTRLAWCNNGLTGSPMIAFDPHYPSFIKVNFGTYYSLSVGSMFGDYFARFAPLFLAHSGSVKIRIKSGANSSVSTRATLFPFGIAGNSPEVTAFSGVNTLDFTLPDFIMDGNLLSYGIRIPQYSKYLAYPHLNFSINTNVEYYNQSVVVLEPVNTVSPISPNNVYLYRSVGEDFQYQFFLGIPTVILTVVAS